MLKIYVSTEAYEAITKSLPKGRKAYPSKQETSGVPLWLDRDTHALLARARHRHESFSETILRLARTEAEAAVTPSQLAVRTRARSLPRRRPPVASSTQNPSAQDT